MTESTWTLRGLPFTTLAWGERTERPTVLLHGFLDSAAAWIGVAERLDGWRLALDQRGHGRSAHTAPGHAHFFPEYIADLDALLAQLPGPVDLVGHSMGGTLATMYAAARPERVRRVVSIDGLGLADGLESAHTRLVAFLDAQVAPPAHRSLPDLEAATTRLLRSTPSLDPRQARQMAEHTTRPDGDGVRWTFDARHRSPGAMPYRQDQHLRLLAMIRCPVLSVHPEHSPFIRSDVARLESAILHLRVVEVPGAGHMVHLEHPGAVADAVRAFLDAPAP